MVGFGNSESKGQADSRKGDEEIEDAAPAVLSSHVARDDGSQDRTEERHHGKDRHWNRTLGHGPAICIDTTGVRQRCSGTGTRQQTQGEHAANVVDKGTANVEAKESDSGGNIDRLAAQDFGKWGPNQRAQDIPKNKDGYEHGGLKLRCAKVLHDISRDAGRCRRRKGGPQHKQRIQHGDEPTSSF